MFIIGETCVEEIGECVFMCQNVVGGKSWLDCIKCWEVENSASMLDYNLKCCSLQNYIYQLVPIPER